jgi:hypothetical protein
MESYRLVTARAALRMLKHAQAVAKLIIGLEVGFVSSFIEESIYTYYRAVKADNSKVLIILGCVSGSRIACSRST